MADAVSFPSRAAAAKESAYTPRHTALVRATHWITTACFFFLLWSGLEIVLSHPRFYWGETGNPLTPALFELPVPSSRDAVTTRYDYVLPDQNGWSRSLHFESAWIVVFTGLVYCVSGVRTRHLRKDLVPTRSDLTWPALSHTIANHLRFRQPDREEAERYNPLQRLAYLSVIFGLFPLLIWTGLAMSPAFTSAFPFTVTVLGGRQSARTIHFFGTVLLVLFVLVHVAMVFRAGFWTRMRAMITGRPATRPPTAQEPLA